MLFTPDRSGFAAYARTHPVVPVATTVLADTVTPVGLYRALAAGRRNTFLLESAEHGRRWARYSFVGAGAETVLESRAGKSYWRPAPPPGFRDGEPILATLAALPTAMRLPELAGLPPLAGGLVGYLGYDLVRQFEKLPDTTDDDLGLPEVAMMLATDVAVLDHLTGTVTLISCVASSGPGDRYSLAVGRLEQMLERLRAPLAPRIDPAPVPVLPADITITTPRGGFAHAVERARQYISAGDVFQVVPSQRFSVPTDLGALELYRTLRVANPSPYMYLLHFDEFDIVGSSPEALIRVEGDRATIRPIAGSRPRGASPAEDDALAAELLADPKERAEHVMLVDLARNDLGRIGLTGSVEVAELMTVARYSHIMHLESTVTARLDPGRPRIEAIAAAFPAGTLTGAPKIRAMEIIDELEAVRRGPYGGAVGYIGFGGDLDLAIAIRTACLSGGHAYVQAGAGIVADSDPAREEAETRHKAAAVLTALGAATGAVTSGVNPAGYGRERRQARGETSDGP